MEANKAFLKNNPNLIHPFHLKKKKWNSSQHLLLNNKEDHPSNQLQFKVIGNKCNNKWVVSANKIITIKKIS